MEKIIDWVGWKLNTMFPNRSRLIEVNGDPYLRRFYIKHSGILPGIYLHYFYRGDGDRDLHNHPWKISFSFILTNGYFEERLSGLLNIKRRELKPGSVNIIRANDFHRVDLRDSSKGVWTIFCTFREIQNWGFWIRESGEYIDNVTYENEKIKGSRSVIDRSLQFDVN